MNKFYKISKSQFDEDITELMSSYDDIIIPKRATKYSAGYDFIAPFDFTLCPNETIKIPTGIKVQLDEDKFLAIVPRSSLGFKYRCQLNNTIGIIDSDYFDKEKNEGHIFVKMTNNGDRCFSVSKGDAFCQGIILQYFLTEDDDSCEERRGGIGSTNR